MKKYFPGHQMIQWIIAIVVSGVILNVVVAFYSLTPGFIHRDGGPTEGIYIPNTVIIMGDEGKSISKIDNNGYINPSSDLVDSGYILVMGNSQSNAIQVEEDKRYIALLNDRIRKNDKVYVYNVSKDGQDFCDLVVGFNAAIQEFPNSSTVILQIGGVNNWSYEKMQNCMLKERAFSEQMRGTYLGEHLSRIQQLKHIIKVTCPFPIYVMEKKVPNINGGFEGAFWPSDRVITEENSDNWEWMAYEKTLDEILKYLKQNYVGKIIILELPSVSLNKNGEIETLGGKRQEIFEQVCKNNSVIYVNMGDVYISEYEQFHVLPYGFNNTCPGYGHLNEEGHRMVAETLYSFLKGSDGK